MRTTLAAAAAILLATTAASSAADMAVKALAPAPVWSWTGLYIGGHVGGGWGTTESTLNSVQVTGGPLTSEGLAIAQNSRSGFLGGGQIGYNFQSNWAVFGVEADFAGLDVTGTTPCIVYYSCTAKSNWLATASGRIGGVVADKTLVYVKGGAAWLNTNHSINIASAVAGLAGLSGLAGTSGDSTTVGALLGFGAEYAFTRNWSAFVEYDYMDFDKKSIAFNLGGSGTALGVANVTVQNKLSVAKAGVNYKF
jgi:outer membrane immunogenic protein